MFSFLNKEELQHDTYYIGVSKYNSIALWDSRAGEFIVIADNIKDGKFEILSLQYTDYSKDNSNEGFSPVIAVPVNLDVVKAANTTGRLTVV